MNFNLSPIQDEIIEQGSQKYKWDTNSNAWRFNQEVLFESGTTLPSNTIGTFGEKFTLIDDQLSINDPLKYTTYTKTESGEYIDISDRLLKPFDLDWEDSSPQPIVSIEFLLNQKGPFINGSVIIVSGGPFTQYFYEYTNDVWVMSTGVSADAEFVINPYLVSLNSNNAKYILINNNDLYTLDTGKWVLETDFAPIETKIGDVCKSNIVDADSSIFQILNNPNNYGTETHDNFGSSVAISGNICAVGAPDEDIVDHNNSGVIYLFDINTGNLLHTLNNPNNYGTETFDSFGEQIVIDGNLCVTSTRYEDNENGTSSGVVYIFNIDTGSLLRTIVNPNIYGTPENDFFGYSIAISNNMIIVGAYGEDDAGTNMSGAAYIFDVTTGDLIHTLNNPNAYDTSSGDTFGNAVSIYGNKCIVGANDEDSDNGSASGAAYIFDVTTGNLLHTLINPGAYSNNLGDYFGYAVSISENICIVGAYQEDSIEGNNSGQVYIFDINTGSLLQSIDSPDKEDESAYENFGRSIDVSDNYIIISAPQKMEGDYYDSGKVYIYDINTYGLLHKITNENDYGSYESDYFGLAVSIFGDKFIVGATGEAYDNGDPRTSSSTGKAYVYNIQSESHEYSGTAIDYTDEQIALIPEAPQRTFVKEVLPDASLFYFEKTVYVINTGSYICIANTETPVLNTDCFWIQT